MRVVGIMSGTSADGIDVAVVDWPESGPARPFELRAYEETPHDPEVQAAVHALAAAAMPAERILPELVRLDRLLADRFADAVERTLARAGLDLSGIAGVASHGQTIVHHPELGGTLQIGCPHRLAERLGVPVVADFRRRDLACDREGAPLAPFFHVEALASPDEDRGVLNLGGIANLTWLPAGAQAEDVVAFDVGPANSVLDALVVLSSDGRQRFDRDGRLAAAGRVAPDWLATLLADPYLDRPAPKSTGREHYGMAYAEELWKRAQAEGLGLEDLLATVVEFVTRAIARAFSEQREGERARRPGSDRPARLILGGGGVRNPVVRARLAAHLGDTLIDSMDDHGVPADAAEAMAFSLMGRNALLGEINQIAGCTGAGSPRVLGTVVAPAPGGALGRTTSRS